MEHIGILGLKHFIISNDSKIIYKILFSPNFKIYNDKITVVKTKFSSAAFKSLSDKEILKLSETAQKLFSFLNQFPMLHKATSIRLYLVEGPVQNIENDYYSVFQVYFYYHLFGSSNDSKILDHESLSKSDVQTLLNGLILSDPDKDESIIIKII